MKLVPESSDSQGHRLTQTPKPSGTVSSWTQALLERMARLSRAMLSLYETGKRSLGRPLLNRLAVTLGHSIEDVDPGRIRSIALDLGNGLDILRVRWLPARVTAAVGRKLEAIAELDEVRRAFLKRKMVVDANLAGINIAEFQREKQ